MDGPMPKDGELEYPDAEDALAPDDTFRILLVDCDEQIERLKEACTDVGYVVVGAASMAAGIKFLNGKDHVDVIVVAAHLDGDSPFELLHFVRNNELHKDTMFLILSLEPGVHGAFLDKNAARAGMALGADAYFVMQQFDEDVLVAEIQKLQPLLPALQHAASAEEKRKAE